MRCLPPNGAPGIACTGPAGQTGWVQQPINWVGYIASLEDTSTFLTDGGYCFEPEACSQANGKWKNTFSVMSFGVGTWLAEYTGTLLTNWKFVPWGTRYTGLLPGSPFVAHRVIDVARVSGTAPEGSTTDRTMISQQRGIIASSPVGSHDCGVGADTTIFYHNFPTEDGLPTGCTEATWSGPIVNSERVFAWAWFDEDEGHLDTADGKDGRSRMFEFIGMPHSIYRSDYVGWLFTYFEHEYINKLRRYGVFGSKDTTACTIPERYTFDHATGRGVWAYRLKLDDEEIIPDSILMQGPAIFADGFESGTTQNWFECTTEECV
jgi:hypothetical protein